MSTIKVDTVRPVTTDASLTLQGDSSGSGVTGITIDSAGDVTVSGGITFSQDITATLSSSSNVKAPLNATGSAPVYACRAWVNFDGTSGSGAGFSDITIRGSGNVSSVTDKDVGSYVINFNTSITDTNYSTQVSCRDETGTGGRLVGNESYAYRADRGTSSVAVETFNSHDSALKDSSIVSVCIFR